MPALFPRDRRFESGSVQGESSYRARRDPTDTRDRHRSSGPSKARQCSGSSSARTGSARWSARPT